MHTKVRIRNKKYKEKHIILTTKCFSYYSQKEMVCELHKRNLRVRSDSNSSL